MMKYTSVVVIAVHCVLCVFTTTCANEYVAYKRNDVKAEEISFINPHVVLQESFKGWGTSLCWWADVVGGMESEISEYVVDALFSPTKLNLNILRYVIGGTTPNNYTCGDYRDGAASESFKDGFDSPYDWNRDLRQRSILEMAKAKGADVFEAFSNSPPQWLTISGCSKGNDRNAPLHANFDAGNSAAFADYATEVIKYFHEELNITFTTFSPFNEPFGLHGIGGWAGSQSSQEGCNMDRATMVAVIQSVHDAITEKNLDFLKIAVSDETQVNTQIQSYDYFANAGVSDLFSQVNVHGYWDEIELSRKDILSLRCNKAGQELWMDEMGWGGTPTDNMEQGLNIANRIIKDLRQMMPSAWVYWQVVENNGGWGLLDVPYQNTTLDGIRYNSGYYAMEQFSQHIRRGSQLIHISNENSIAAYHPADQILAIVTVNPDTTETTLQYDIAMLESFGSLELFRTSPNEQHDSLPPPTVSAGSVAELTLPPQSISTLVVSDVKLSPTLNNLIQNGGFESVEDVSGSLIPTSWTLQGAGNDDGVILENAWRGVYSGVLRTGVNVHTALTQSVTLNDGFLSAFAPCNLYLTAWCSSTAAGTVLEVRNDDMVLSQVEINRNGAYNSYGVSFPANSGETILINFANNGSLLNGVAKIDNVSLYMKCGV